MSTRIYRVTDGDHVRLIEAPNAAQALRFCAAQRYTVKAASAQEVAKLMGAGAEVEQITATGGDGANE